MSSALSISNLTCKYDSQTILKSLDLRVEKGEIICLLGASGCGKTTLLKAIAGLLPLSSGEMTLNQRTIDDGDHWVPPEQRNIGLIFQDYALFPHLTVAQNVAFGLKGVAKTEASSIVQEMLHLVHLDEYGERYPHQLSGGQQQRVAIARSLAYKPDLLLLDEPFSNIDTQVRHELIGQIRSIFKEQGVTAVFVTHSREEAFAFADKMAVMNNGVIEQFGTASELYHQPSSQFVADFLGGGSYLTATRTTQKQYQCQLGNVNAIAKREIELGSTCEILVRPNQLVLKASLVSDVRVLEIHFMGDHCRYTVNLDGQVLVASSNEALELGQRVSIEVQAEQLLAF